MSIIRGARPESGWYALDKRISEDGRLSWAARGLLVFLLGKPDNWQVSVEHLRKQTEGARIRTGRDGVYALLAELQTAGYIVAAQARREDGTLAAVEYTVRECRAPSPAPLPAQPDTAQPLPAQPYTAETTLTKTDISTKTDSNQGQRARKRAADPVVVLPEWLPPAAWADFVAFRRQLKAPLTQRAAELVLDSLAKFHTAGDDPVECINQSIRNGWRGVFAQRGNFRGNANGGVGRTHESEAERVERINREHDQREGYAPF